MQFTCFSACLSVTNEWLFWIVIKPVPVPQKRLCNNCFHMNFEQILIWSIFHFFRLFGKTNLQEVRYLNLLCNTWLCEKNNPCDSFQDLCFQNQISGVFFSGNPRNLNLFFKNCVSRLFTSSDFILKNHDF